MLGTKSFKSPLRPGSVQFDPVQSGIIRFGLVQSSLIRTQTSCKRSYVQIQDEVDTKLKENPMLVCSF